jgi:hypothetical protein
LRNVVVFDVLSSKKIIREPRSLYDAWIQSIMIPLVEIAKDDIRLFENVHNKDGKINLLRIPFDIPERHWPQVLDWSYSNLSELYDIGYAAGQKFYEKNEQTLRAAALQPTAGAGSRGAAGGKSTAKGGP